MKRRLRLFLLPFLAFGLLAGTASLVATTSDSLAPDAAARYAFTKAPTSLILVSNRGASGSLLYVKFNDDDSTVSTTNYDFVLDRFEEMKFEGDFLKRYPVSSVGVYDSETTPVARVIGWR